MNKLFCLFALLSFTAHAESARVPATWTKHSTTVNFQSFNTYYSCSAAESAVEDTLEQLGAKNVDVTCFGGLEQGQPFVDVQADFEALTYDARASTLADVKTVELEGNDACDLHESVAKQLLPEFAYGKGADVNNSNCWDARGTYSLQATLFFPAAR